MLLSGALPQSIGMLLLQKAHIGEVQVVLWPQDVLDACDAAGIPLL